MVYSMRPISNVPIALVPVLTILLLLACDPTRPILRRHPRKSQRQQPQVNRRRHLRLQPPTLFRPTENRPPPSQRLPPTRQCPLPCPPSLRIQRRLLRQPPGGPRWTRLRPLQRRRRSCQRPPPPSASHQTPQNHLIAATV